MNRSRFRGSLLGLAAGDALGTTLEFRRPGSFTPITDIVGGGPFHLQPGEWTDDTSMALCLADSLIETKAFDPIDQLERYMRWYRHGYFSVKGRCFDIGNTTRSALDNFASTKREYPGPTHPDSAGNGSIMRLCPVPLRYAANPEDAIFYSAQSSRTTHGAAECVDACRYFGGLIVGAVQGRPKDELLSTLFSPVPGAWEKVPLAAKITEVAMGSFKDSDSIRGSGYVVKSLEAALWAFHRTDNFRDGALLAVNLGDDADTTGAVYGQIAGAFYGEEGIPVEWRAKLAMRERIEELADGLLALSG
jgi:ADP-ribosylglycohydrolase